MKHICKVLLMRISNINYLLWWKHAKHDGHIQRLRSLNQGHIPCILLLDISGYESQQILNITISSTLAIKNRVISKLLQLLSKWVSLWDLFIRIVTLFNITMHLIVTSTQHRNIFANAIHFKNTPAVLVVSKDWYRNMEKEIYRC